MTPRILPAAAALALAATAACTPRMQPVRPLHPNGAVVPTTADATVASAAAAGAADRDRVALERDRTMADALSSCTPATCDALARGRVALGMTEAQVLAATGTTAAAWETRAGGRVTTLAARSDAARVSDAVGQVAFVTLQDGRVRSYTYREPQGLRLVASAADATPQAEARDRAEAMLREGHEFALRGDFRAALDRYDRADVIRPGDPETTLHIARALDKQLRPVEAVMRYQLFLHQMELEKIRAHGEAYAHMYAAIAEARDRIIVLDRGRR